MVGTHGNPVSLHEYLLILAGSAAIGFLGAVVVYRWMSASITQAVKGVGLVQG